MYGISDSVGFRFAFPDRDWQGCSNEPLGVFEGFCNSVNTEEG
jgi:hypothetical protein